MRALAGSLVLAVASVVLIGWSVKDDPCAGHVTPDGIAADQMGPCDEMPGVA